MFSLKPDYEKSKERYMAFWESALIDRPPVCLPLAVDKPTPVPEKTYKTYRKMWLDIDFRAEAASIAAENTTYYGDALPVVWPNMGPEIFSAWCGCGYEFGETTTWSEPCIFDWERDAPKAVFSEEHPLYKSTVDFTKKLIERGKGKFITGLTDFHAGGDHLAALRDPQELAIDMIDNVHHVKKKLKESQDECFRVYDFFYDILKSAGLPITSWTPLISNKKNYIIQNDFSCMISTEMFDDVFLPGIVDECKFYDHTIYHLDGPGALKHLDSLLQIKELNAIQWVSGAGEDKSFLKWASIYKKIQAAGKGIQLVLNDVNELPQVFETLSPQGIWISRIGGVNDQYTADEVLKRVSVWK